MEYFNYEDVARKAGIDDATLDCWREYLRRKYGGDEMMVELRLLRTCHAVAIGAASIESATKFFQDKPTRPSFSHFR